MAWGFQSWDENGRANNYGIVPITVVGRFPLSFEQVSGGASFSVPQGYRLEYIQAPTSTGYTERRRVITINGGSVSISEGGRTSFGIGTESAQAAIIVIYLRRL
ncbi:hypothetical protein KC222_14670 [Cedecea davisae]|uniref:Uncharacterized protein n=1 Tax=Cedecea davisae TaxID=158484 RepID=A0ABS6DJ53_9ENTR|nr:hypothetical protein [Cedecea davisae]MBU4683254.1 hypothetical protein [Cedecea davisae]MBU4686718.1 hypothetical protein [Cedecea davisae]